MPHGIIQQKNIANTWENICIQTRLKQRKKGKSFHPVRTGIDWLSVKSFIKTGMEILAKALLIAVLCYGGFHGYRYITTSPMFTIEKVALSGQKVLAGQNLDEWMGPLKGNNIFLVDLKTVSQNLNAHPWIKSVSVTRKFPKTLFIHIEERIPYARIQFDRVYLLDNFGILLSPATPEYSELPLITGVEAKKIELGERVTTKDLIRGLQTLYYLNRLEYFRDDPFNLLHMKNDYRVTFTSRNRGIKVHMTVDMIENGFRNLKIILNAIKTEDREIQYIDLSFKDKVVIKQTHGPKGV